ncbi:MAG TPA: 2-succinyl-5-enolpyruvyl-6-hydroxy-3-cyclohexene-1-carboxylic-acid synthase [Nocardioidaceae bacterium]|nr:2-succinyl-5-enolpyruvyl-6-hydroxy-3-cyclohexene-1-carboxylic-acid synthase [Nocardioidaceae bacterium]
MTHVRPPGPPDGSRNASTAMATVLLDELVRCGVREIVLAPGSRSAALAFAAQAAAELGRVRLHVRIDERTAAFLALGMAKASHRPVPVITTSGTAVANLHPAVLEASHAGVPLVVLTADRPAGLRGTRANQTTDQVKIFGNAVRAFADVPPAFPGPSESLQCASWRSLVARTVATASGSTTGAPGPVHVNTQFAHPLTPDSADGWTSHCPGRPHGMPWTTPAEPRQPQPENLDRDRRTVVVAGDDAGPPARVLAETAGWPLLAEPTSGARTGHSAIRTYRLLLSDPALADRIERVVVCGHPTMSRPVNRLLSRSDVEVVAVPTGPGWTDPGHRVSRVVNAVQGQPAPTPSPWLREWQERDAELSRRLDRLLADQGELIPHQVAAAVSAALPPHGLLFVGASNPVRDLDLVVARYPVGEHRLVIANRGLAGIDGSVSTVVGAALARSGTTRSFALLGDLTFLHDGNGLVIGPQEARPDLMIVVVNDDGGSVFASLEQGGPSYSSSFERLFGTPHGADLAALCQVSRTPHRRVSALGDLTSALQTPTGGVEVVEAVVRRDNRRDLDARISDLVWDG